MSIKAPALRVIVAQLRERANAELEAYTKAHPEPDFYKLREAREKQVGAALLREMLKRPLRYIGTFDAYGTMQSNEAWKAVVKAVKEKIPEIEYNHGCQVAFAALNIT